MSSYKKEIKENFPDCYGRIALQSSNESNMNSVADDIRQQITDFDNRGEAPWDTAVTTYSVGSAVHMLSNQVLNSSLDGLVENKAAFSYQLRWMDSDVYEMHYLPAVYIALSEINTSLKDDMASFAAIAEDCFELPDDAASKEILIAQEFYHELAHGVICVRDLKEKEKGTQYEETIADIFGALACVYKYGEEAIGTLEVLSDMRLMGALHRGACHFTSHGIDEALSHIEKVGIQKIQSTNLNDLFLNSIDLTNKVSPIFLGYHDEINNITISNHAPSKAMLVFNSLSDMNGPMSIDRQRYLDAVNKYIPSVNNGNTSIEEFWATGIKRSKRDIKVNNDFRISNHWDLWKYCFREDLLNKRFVDNYEAEYGERDHAIIEYQKDLMLLDNALPGLGQSIKKVVEIYAENAEDCYTRPPYDGYDEAFNKAYEDDKKYVIKKAKSLKL